MADFGSFSRFYGPWSVFTPGWQTERARGFIYSHPSRQYVRWWKALPSPYYDPRTGKTQAPDATQNSAVFQYVEQSVSKYQALFRDVDLRLIYSSAGKYIEGDQICVSMPDELPFGQYDIIQPLGSELVSSTPPLMRNARSYRYSETIRRGWKQVAQAGLLTSSGATVTTSGSFAALEILPGVMRAIQAGDIITSAGQSLVVSVVGSTTQVTLASAPSPAWAGFSWSLGVDLLRQNAVSTVENINATSGAYVLGVDFKVSSSGQAVEWLSTHSPAPDEGYGVSYRFIPRYQVIPDLGTIGPALDSGHFMPQIVTMRLVQPETFIW